MLIGRGQKSSLDAFPTFIFHKQDNVKHKMFIRLLIRSHTFIFTSFKSPSQLKQTVSFLIIKSQKKVYIFHSLSKYMSLSREMSLSSLLNNPCSVTTQLPVSTVYIPPICCICLFFIYFFWQALILSSTAPFSNPRSVPRDKKNKKHLCFFVNKYFTWTHWKLISAGLRHRIGSEMT